MFEEISSIDDTLPSVEQMKFALLRKMTPQERLHRFFNLCAAARKFVNSGIYLRHPNCSEEEFRKRKAAILLGKEYTQKYYNWDPEIEGY